MKNVLANRSVSRRRNTIACAALALAMVPAASFAQGDLDPASIITGIGTGKTAMIGILTAAMAILVTSVIWKLTRRASAKI